MVSEGAIERCDGSFVDGLNPCFSGGWSRSLEIERAEKVGRAVLILVLVEDGLGGLVSSGRARG